MILRTGLGDEHHVGARVRPIHTYIGMQHAACRARVHVTMQTITVLRTRIYPGQLYLEGL